MGARSGKTVTRKRTAAAKTTKAAAKAAPRDGGADKDRTRGDRSKRLLDLVLLLLRARSPVTFRDIREQFTAYKTANNEAGLRAFERDKADLLELGVPIRYITPEEDDSLEEGGYVVDLKRFRLPPVNLTADEVSALVLAASVARAVPGGVTPKIVDLTLRKLAFDLPEAPDTPTEFPLQPSAVTRRAPVLVHFPEIRPAGDRDLGETFAELEAATRNRKRVTLRYQSASNGLVRTRDVDPYALVYRQSGGAESAWLLVGWCHLRKEVRSFRIDRIHGLEVAPKPKSPDFERPADFDVRAYVSRSPWTFRSEPVEPVDLELGPDAADVANEDFGPEAAISRAADRVRVRFPCGNPDFVVSRVLAAKGSIRVLAGAEVKRRLAEELDVLARSYAG